MTPRERVNKAINFDYPDRPPISHAVLPSAQIAYGDELSELLQSVDEDFGWSELPDLSVADYPAQYKTGNNIDAFGTGWHGEKLGICGIPKEVPLEDLANYKDYQWPEFKVGQPSHKLYSGHVSNSQDRYYARGGWIVYFEQAQQMRGFTNLMMDIALRDSMNERFLEDLLEFNLDYIDSWLEVGYDGLHFADDWGSQRSLMISPDDWRRIFKPSYKKMFQKVIDKGVDVHFHSDGQIKEIIPDLIDIGVKVINCQVNVVGLDYVKKHFAGKVCFRTDLDRQNVMVFGTPDQVRSHIHDVFTHIGSEAGGIIACGEIGDDTPLENIKAMYDEFVKFRF